MSAVSLLRPEFVEFIPEKIERGTLYVSMPYATAVHSCCCGCGREVVTPFSPTDWRLTFDGETVSLAPSIGNWSFECQSHYWIERGRIRWSTQWTPEEIAAGRLRDQAAKAQHYGSIDAGVDRPAAGPAKSSWWKSIADWLFGRGEA